MTINVHKKKKNKKVKPVHCLVCSVTLSFVGSHSVSLVHDIVYILYNYIFGIVARRTTRIQSRRFTRLDGCPSGTVADYAPFELLACHLNPRLLSQYTSDDLDGINLSGPSTAAQALPTLPARSRLGIE